MAVPATISTRGYCTPYCASYGKSDLVHLVLYACIAVAYPLQNMDFTGNALSSRFVFSSYSTGLPSLDSSAVGKLVDGDRSTP